MTLFKTELSSMEDHKKAVQGDIARRAYALYEADDFKDGLDLDHWFRAERELSVPDQAYRRSRHLNGCPSVGCRLIAAFTPRWQMRWTEFGWLVGGPPPTLTTSAEVPSALVLQIAEGVRLSNTKVGALISRAQEDGEINADEAPPSARFKSIAGRRHNSHEV